MAAGLPNREEDQMILPFLHVFFVLKIQAYCREEGIVMRVLIVDDAMFMRTMLKTIITKAGHSIAGEASNGKEAVELYSEVKPDLVTMDITMPEMTGIEAVRAIRQIDKQANIIMFSAMGQQGMVVEAIQAGAKDFVVKPFDEKRVLEAIGKIGTK
jgi:two-component system, chemotaxis family, chemotaxis protein CheY